MASIFPDIVIPDKVINQASAEPVTYGKELAFDFAASDFVMEDGSPKVVEGIEALKVWIEKTIRTAKFRFKIYDDQYGCQIDEIIGYDVSRAVLESEVQRVIREALIYDNRIADVRDFQIERGDDWLKVTFTVYTTLDDTFIQEVSI